MMPPFKLLLADIFVYPAILTFGIFFVSSLEFLWSPIFEFCLIRNLSMPSNEYYDDRRTIIEEALIEVLKEYITERGTFVFHKPMEEQGAKEWEKQWIEVEKRVREGTNQAERKALAVYIQASSVKSRGSNRI